jgi:hypothetical protein
MTRLDREASKRRLPLTTRLQPLSSAPSATTQTRLAQTRMGQMHQEPPDWDGSPFGRPALRSTAPGHRSRRRCVIQSASCAGHSARRAQAGPADLPTTRSSEDAFRRRSAHRRAGASQRRRRMPAADPSACGGSRAHRHPRRRRTTSTVQLMSFVLSITPANTRRGVCGTGAGTDASGHQLIRVIYSLYG